MMSFDTRLLNTLADAEFHSGEELGKLLGVSRTAIWKQLQKIETDTTLKFESVKGRGYRLVGGIELLDSKKISAAISTPPSLLYKLHIVEQVDSTNRLAMELAQNNSERGLVVLAEQQLAGRGRRGRQWISPFGRNIYCSVVWEFDMGAAALEGLSLAVGVALVRALEMSGVHGVMLKWPNDVLHEQRKLAGILIEMMGDTSGRCQVVIGIGVNVAMTSESDSAAIDQPWIDANSIAGKTISRNQLIAHLLMQLLPLLNKFEKKGFANFIEEWSALDCMRGQKIALHYGEQVLHGVAAGVDRSGALAIDTDVGRQWFHGGEVSLRLHS